jgi:hypothetical protein
VIIADPESGALLSHIIREYGLIAIQRLRANWQDVSLYDDTLGDYESVPSIKAKSKVAIRSDYYGISAPETQRFGMGFQSFINEYCYRVGSHGCILPNNHPSANAVMIEHGWNETDRHLYRTSGLLPVSFLSNKICITLKFISVRLSGDQSAETTISQCFELAM